MIHNRLPALLFCALAACSSSSESPPETTSSTSATTTSTSGSGGEGGTGGVGGSSTGGAAPTCEIQSIDVPLAFPAPSWDTDPDAKSPDIACALASATQHFPPDAVICSGEDAHGVRESSYLHAALARHLVKDKGMKVFTMEVPDADAALVEAFVRTGDDTTLKTYLQGTKGSMASTQEAEIMFRALRTLALELPSIDDLSIRGIDVAVDVDATLDRFLAFLQKVDPANAASLSGSLPHMSALSAAKAKPAGDAVAAFLGGWAAAEASYVSASSEAEAAIGHLDAENLRDGYWFLSLYIAGNFAAGDAKYREPGMTKNLGLFAGQSGVVMLLAHDGHCAKTETIGGTPSLGSQFSVTAEGARYVVLAQSYGGGTQRILSNGGIVEQPVGTHSLAKNLSPLSPAEAFIMSADSSAWDGNKIFTGEYNNSFKPAADFDVMVFLRTVTPTHAWP